MNNDYISIRSTELSLRPGQVQAAVEDTLSAEEGTRIYAVITFDPEAFNSEL
jgi:hypothetical protein